jgi:hypothetical protein
VVSSEAIEGLPLTVENRFEARLDWVMMGRSESRDGCLAMSVVQSSNGRLDLVLAVRCCRSLWKRGRSKAYMTRKEIRRFKGIYVLENCRRRRRKKGEGEGKRRRQAKRNDMQVRH